VGQPADTIFRLWLLSRPDPDADRHGHVRISLIIMGVLNGMLTVPNGFLPWDLRVKSSFLIVKSSFLIIVRATAYLLASIFHEAGFLRWSGLTGCLT